MPLRRLPWHVTPDGERRFWSDQILLIMEEYRISARRIAREIGVSDRAVRYWLARDVIPTHRNQRKLKRLLKEGVRRGSKEGQR